MNRYSFGCLLLAMAFTLGLSSCENEADDPIIEEEITHQKTNEWIYKVMEGDYLWYDELPAKRALNLNQDPDVFFESLLSDKDGVTWNGNHLYFSSIEKKQEATRSISELDPTYGFDYIVYGVEAQSFYFARVLYVLPGSPAEEAGLKRDDWISGVNGSDENLVDYSVLNGGSGLTVKIRKRNYSQGRWEDKGDLTFPAARVMENNPFFKDSVFVYGDRKVGYLVYNHFSSQAEGKTDKAYDNQMKSLFSSFKAEGVNEFVLDLRFNGGGLVSSAQLLASLLAPSAALGKTFCTLTYNDKKNRKSELKFDNTVSGANLNLKRLYVLTGQFTASASEAIINCLRPYMGESQVRVIGDWTVGKAVGSSPYGEKEEYDWILHPITLRIVNGEGKADYGQVGFKPDIEIYEYNTNPFYALYPLGDTREILLSLALKDMLGEDTAVKSLRAERITDDKKLIPIYSSLEHKNTNGLKLSE